MLRVERAVENMVHREWLRTAYKREGGATICLGSDETDEHGHADEAGERKEEEAQASVSHLCPVRLQANQIHKLWAYARIPEAEVCEPSLCESWRAHGWALKLLVLVIRLRGGRVKRAIVIVDMWPQR